MPELRIEAKIEAKGVQSLIWNGESLFDWVGGGQRFELDGRTIPRRVYYAFRFDAAVVSPSGQYVVIYERLGTKGLLLCNGSIIREINRSYYHATAYEYPICFAMLQDGREVLIHCPEDYCRIDIEEAATGTRLTSSIERKPADVFHSRLMVDRSNQWLISAGWFWHPFDVLRLFSLAETISNPTSLDDSDVFPHQQVEVSTAVFAGSNKLLLSTSDETFSDGDYQENEFKPKSLGVWDIEAKRICSMVDTAEPAGTLMPINDEFAVSFYKHPKIVNLRTGEITCRMPELNCGDQTSSIIHHIDALPPLAIDAANNRFAVATSDQIVVVHVDI
jgi:hypothetical protein